MSTDGVAAREDTLRRNLAALARSDPALAALLLRTPPAADARVEGTPPVLRVGGRAVDAPEDPAGTPRRLVQGAPELARLSMVAMFGLGSGHDLRAFRERVNARCRLVVLEPRAGLLRATLEAVDLSDLLGHPHVVLISGEGDPDLLQRMRNTVWYRELVPFSDQYLNYAVPGRDRLEPGVAAGLFRRFEEVLHFIAGLIGDDPDDTVVGFRQILDNVDLLLEGPSLDVLAGSYRGVPAICVAAGPSLERNIRELHRAAGRALILAADTIHARLRAEGIVPDAVARRERTRWGYEHHLQGRPMDPRTVLVGRAVVTPEIFRHHPGPSIAMLSVPDLERHLAAAMGGANLVESILSVAHLNVAFARRLGCDPIVLIGQDLAYGEAGRAYAGGTAYGSKAASGPGEGAEERVRIPGVGGTTVESTPLWRFFRDGLEVQVAEHRGTCVQASEGGARIRGTVEMSLGQAIDRWCVAPLPRPLDEALRAATRLDGPARRARLAAALGGRLADLERRRRTLEGLRTSFGALEARLAAGPAEGALSSSYARLNQALGEMEQVAVNDPFFGSVCSPASVAFCRALNPYARASTPGDLAAVARLAVAYAGRAAGLAGDLHRAIAERLPAIASGGRAAERSAG